MLAVTDRLKLLPVGMVISGGQTGADQGGLFGARRAGVQTGGYAPNGWITETGPEPRLADFGLEQYGTGYAPRTLMNIQSSDFTVLFGDKTSSGSAMTMRFARQHSRALLVIDDPKDGDAAVEVLLEWLRSTMPTLVHARLMDKVPGSNSQRGFWTMNVAGNRESVNPGLFVATRDVVSRALRFHNRGAE